MYAAKKMSRHRKSRQFYEVQNRNICVSPKKEDQSHFHIITEVRSILWKQTVEYLTRVKYNFWGFHCNSSYYYYLENIEREGIIPFPLWLIFYLRSVSIDMNQKYLLYEWNFGCAAHKEICQPIRSMGFRDPTEKQGAQLSPLSCNKFQLYVSVFVKKM